MNQKSGEYEFDPQAAEAGAVVPGQPIVPAKSQPRVREAYVGDHIHCRQCSAGLRGLPASGKCPQCGQNIAESVAAMRSLPGKLGQMSLPRQVFVLAAWPFAEQLLNFLVGFVDTMLAGRLSVEATDAMSIGANMGWFIALLQLALAVGASALVARAVGGSHRRLANAALGQAVLLSLVAGVAIGTLVFAIAPQIADFMGTVGQAHTDAVLYLRMLSLVAPCSGLFFVGTACLRAAGDVRSPFFVLAIVNIVNAVISMTLVYAPAPLGGHGFAGITYGTAIAWVIGFILILVLLIGPWGGIRLRWIRLRPHPKTMWRIYKVATPSFVEVSGHWFSNFIILNFVGIVARRSGEQGLLGSHLVAIRLEALSFLCGFAIGTAASTLVGQYLGLGDPHRARQAALLCWRYAMIFMGTMSVIFFLFPEFFVRLVTDEEQLLKLAPNVLRIAALMQIPFATSIVFSNAMRGAGDTKTTMKVGYFVNFVLRVPGAFIIGVWLNWSLFGIWIALTCEMTLRGMIYAWLFFRGKWLKVQV